MQDTACGDNCAFVKAGMCSNCTQCPNYVESVWCEHNSQEPKLIKDCTPKRSLLMLQEMYNRIFAVQQSQVEVREETNKLNEFFGKIRTMIESKKRTEIE